MRAEHSGFKGLNDLTPQCTAEMARARQMVQETAGIGVSARRLGRGEPIDNGASQAIVKLARTL